jgi:predicted SprT family Zn-dependent metalloprotease
MSALAKVLHSSFNSKTVKLGSLFIAAQSIANFNAKWLQIERKYFIEIILQSELYHLFFCYT